ncbi:MAG: cystathionine gamma-synthase [Acidobacteria bacterium]|nr:MAG: cystathionine gamma-synthase [Acidobacteriota bacterium]
MTKDRKGFSTRAIHDGQEPDALTGAVGVPIYATSTFQQDELGKSRLGYEYSRVSNPTRSRLEANLASLEGGIASRVFASGMAALSAVCQLLKPGDHVVAGNNLYGGTWRFFTQVMPKFGVEFTYVDTRGAECVEAAMRSNTRFVYIETPTNPLMLLTDIAAVSKVAHARGAEVIVDNTFLSPYFQRPLELGADMVMHSTTKFLNGHSDGLGGVIVCSTEQQASDLAFIQKAYGAIMSPFESWLVLRGVKTLPVRMKQHDVNGRAVAEFLQRHPRVEKVFYPGLADHPQHELAKRQMKGFGSMICFETGSLENAKKVLKQVKLCVLGDSLGGVETLISHPATMANASLGAEVRAKIGLTDGMVRLSVGIEDVEDILADLEQALAAI